MDAGLAYLEELAGRRNLPQAKPPTPATQPDPGLAFLESIASGKTQAVAETAALDTQRMAANQSQAEFRRMEQRSQDFALLSTKANSYLNSAPTTPDPDYSFWGAKPNGIADLFVDRPQQPMPAGEGETVVNPAGPDQRVARPDAIGFREALAQNPTKFIPVAGSLFDTTRLMSVMDAAKRLEQDSYPETVEFTGYVSGVGGYVPTGMTKPPSITGKEQRQRDLQLVTDWENERRDAEERGYDFGGRVGQILGELPAFMGEIALTSGAGGVVKKVTTEALEKVVGKSLVKGIGGKVAGTVAAGVTQGTLMPQRTAAAYMQRRMPDVVKMDEQGNPTFSWPEENPYTSLLRAWGDTAIEAVSERSGGAVNAVGRGIGKVLGKTAIGGKIMPRIYQGYKRLHPDTTWAQFVDKASTTAGFNGILGEVGEEYIGDQMRAVTDVDDFGAGKDSGILDRMSAAFVQDVTNTPEMLVSFAVPGVTRIAAKQVLGQKPVEPGRKTPYENEQPKPKTMDEFAAKMRKEQGLDELPVIEPGRNESEESQKKVIDELPIASPEDVKPAEAQAAPAKAKLRTEEQLPSEQPAQPEPPSAKPAQSAKSAVGAGPEFFEKEERKALQGLGYTIREIAGMNVAEGRRRIANGVRKEAAETVAPAPGQDASVTPVVAAREGTAQEPQAAKEVTPQSPATTPSTPEQKEVTVQKQPWEMTWGEIKTEQQARRAALPAQVAAAEAKYADARKQYDDTRKKQSNRIKAILKRIARLNPTGDLDNVSTADKRIIAELESERDQIVLAMRDAQAPIRSDFVSAETAATYIPSGQYEHINAVKRAVSGGKPVPRAVLEEYKSEPWAAEALSKLEKGSPRVEEVQTQTEKVETKTAPSGTMSAMAEEQGAGGTQTPSTPQTAEGATREELKSKRQMYLDNIATKRAKKESIPQAWLDGLAAVEDQIENRVPGEGIASNPVFGHPQSTNIMPDKYGQLVPIRASNREQVERRIEQAQRLLDELQTKWGKAQAVIAGRIKATPSQNKEAKAYLGSMNGTEDETVIELLRTETLPELNRLLRSFNPTPRTQSAGTQSIGPQRQTSVEGAGAAGTTAAPALPEKQTPKPTAEQLREIKAKGIAPLPDNHPLVVEAQRAADAQDAAKDELLRSAPKTVKTAYDPVGSALHHPNISKAKKDAYRDAKKAYDKAFEAADDEAERLAIEQYFANQSSPSETPTAVSDKEEPAATEGKGENGLSTADRKIIADLRKSADGMQAQIDAKRNPAIAQQNVTARRANIAAGMAAEADAMEQVQKATRAIADARENGTLPESLKGVTKKTQVDDILNSRSFPTVDVHQVHYRDMMQALEGKKGSRELRSKLSDVYHGDTQYYFRGASQIEAAEQLVKMTQDKVTGAKWLSDSIKDYRRMIAAGIENESQFSQAKSDLADLMGPKKTEPDAQRQIREKTAALIGVKVPGFFPTPKPVAEGMVDAAEIEDGMTVLEPSAGKGDLADVIREKTGITPDTIETSSTLGDILRLKGYEPTEADFLEQQGQYDRILMNPPYEKGQDINHVRHAYDMLKPGGRIVALMSEGSFSRSDSKATGFREWLDEVGGTSEKLAQGSFTGKDSFRQTGVAVRQVVIEKPVRSTMKEQEKEQPSPAPAEATAGKGARTVSEPASSPEVSRAIESRNFDTLKALLQPGMDENRDQFLFETGIALPDSVAGTENTIGEFVAGRKQSPATSEKKTGGSPGKAAAPGKLGGIAGPGMPMTMEPVAEKPPVTARQIIEGLGRALMVPIRGMATNRSGTKAGWYEVGPKGIRQVNVQALDTTAHEIGHHIDHAFKIRQAGVNRAGHRMYRLPPGLEKGADKELLALGKQLYGDTKPAGGYKSEGIAEFIRGYLTEHIEVRVAAPKFYKWFVEDYLPDNPDVASALKEAKTLLTEWRRMGAEARIESKISEKQPKGPIVSRVQAARQWIYGALWDELIPLKTAVEQSGATLDPKDNPYDLATYLNQTEGARARHMILDGTIDIWGNRTGKGLKEVMEPIVRQRAVNEFRRWMISARALDLISRGIDPGISKEDAQFVYDKYKDNEGWKEAAEDVTAWNSRVLDYLVQAGGLEADAAARMRELNPVYVPFLREFAKGEKAALEGVGRGVLPQGKVHGIKGSGREIIDPYQGMIQQAQRLVSLAHKTMVAKSLADLADKTPGMASIMWPVPAPKQATTFQAEQVKRQLMDLGVEFPEGGLETMDALLTVYTNSPVYRGKDNIISIVRNGKRSWYEVDPVLYRVLKGLDQFTLPAYLRWTIALPTRVMRFGATGINAAFGWVRNPIRDTLNTVFSARFARGPFATMKGLAMDLSTTGLAKAMGVKPNEAAEQYLRQGGEISGFVGQDRSGLQHVKGEMLASTVGRKTIHTVTHPFDAMRELFGISENAPRMAEYAAALKKYEEQYGKDSPNARIMAFNAASDQTINFRRHGWIGKWLNQLIPFWNAAMQDPDKIVRTFKTRGVEATAWATALLTLPAVALWWWDKDDEWYKELPDYERANYLHIQVGEDRIIRLPVPFLVGHLFQSVPVAALDALYRSDPKRVTEVLGEAFKSDVGAIANAPAFISPLLEVAANKDWSGKPIVTESMRNKQPNDQYTKYTGDFARAVASAINSVSPRKVAPVQLQYLMNAYSGGIYSRTQKVVQTATKSADERQLADLPVFGTLFVRDPYAPRDSIERFYSRREELNQAYTSDKTKMTGSEMVERTRINRAGLELTEIWKELRDTGNEAQRRRLYGQIKGLIDSTKIDVSDSDLLMDIAANTYRDKSRDHNAGDPHKDSEDRVNALKQEYQKRTGRTVTPQDIQEAQDRIRESEQQKRINRMK